MRNRKRVEGEPSSVKDERESRIQERTAALAESNQALLGEMEARQTTTEEFAWRHQGLLARHRVSEIVLHTRSLDVAFQEIVDEIGSRLPFPVVTIALYDAARDMMVFKAVKGISWPPKGGSLEMPAAKSLSGIVAHT